MTQSSEHTMYYCQVVIPGLSVDSLMYSISAPVDPSGLIGSRVLVPVKKRKYIGIIVHVTDEKPDVDYEFREILDVLDSTPALSAEMMKLTHWVSDYYVASWGSVLKTALPSELLKQPSLEIKWTGSEFEGMWSATIITDRNLVKLARIIAAEKKITYRKLAGRSNPNRLRERLTVLELDGLISIREIIRKSEKSSFTYEEVVLNEEYDLSEIPEHHKAQQRVLDVLKAEGGIATWTLLRKSAGVERTTLKALIERDALKVRTVSDMGLLQGFDPRSSKAGQQQLTGEQEKALEVMKSARSSEKTRTVLFSGPPGGGKTRVYIELLKTVLEDGKSVLLLVPEIALTPQVISRIRTAVDVPVAVLHSALSDAQRITIWREIHSGNVKIVVGPRSAVFAPLQDLGLIIVDEEHEESYKQADLTPRYHGRDVALMRGAKAGAPVVLVSATPSLEALRLLEAGQAVRAELSNRFGSGWPEVRIVDRRREMKDSPYIGKELAAEIIAREGTGEGILLLITRRGFAPVLLCNDCGWKKMCENCALPLTYHRNKGQGTLRCHLCGYRTAVPVLCEECGSANLRVVGMGTQRIEQEILSKYPAFVPVRMDSDTTKKAGKHEELLKSFAVGDAQMLLGTQMIAKGHDFSHVTLVGIVNADPSLMLPDFRASEKTFRLLVQAAGRAGRGEQEGKVLVQTLMPTHQVFVALSRPGGPDIEGFLHNETQIRKMFNYPPYAKMVILTLASEKDEDARKISEQIGQKLRTIGEPLLVNGPMQSLVPRVKRHYRWRITIRTPRSKDPSGHQLRTAIQEVKKSISIPHNVLLMIDVDPLEVV